MIRQHLATPSSNETSWLPAEIALDLRDVRPGAIRFAGTFRQMDDFAPPSNSTKRFTVCGLPAPRLKISFDAIGRRREEKGARHVGDEDEIAPLRAVADDGERLARELLREENAEHRAVGARRLRNACRRR